MQWLGKDRDDMRAGECEFPLFFSQSVRNKYTHIYPYPYTKWYVHSQENYKWLPHADVVWDHGLHVLGFTK